MSSDVSPILALDKISKRFGAVVVASDIDLALAEGEALGIIGPNGAGKTTLFGMVTGTVTPDAGRVLLDGRDITALLPQRRCRLGIGRSFQVPQPFGGMTRVREHRRRGGIRRGRRERDVYAGCARRFSTAAASSTKPTGRAGSLTLLDRKRLELARALATEPRCCCSTRSPAASPSTNARRSSP